MNIKKAYKKILLNEQVVDSLKFLKKDDENTLKEQLEIVQIPSPSFEEADKAAFLIERLKKYGLSDISKDKAGNVIGIRPGSGNGLRIAVSSHMDTVFPKETDLTLTRDGDIYRAPSICDATRTLAEILSVLRALESVNVKTVGDIMFVFTVGEEAKGDLFGSRHLFKTRNDIDAFITIDTAMAHGIVYRAQGGNSYEITFNGNGGHGFIDFGTPSANNALGRAIAKIADMEIDSQSNTTFNVGIVSGGTTSNVICAQSKMTLNLRSDDEENLNIASEKALKLVEEAVKEENDRWKSPHPVEADIQLLSSRPSGSQPSNSPFVQVLCEATGSLGLEVKLATPASTDANIPISMGIPAACIGHGGTGGGVHSTDEWFSPVDSYYGPQRAILTLYGLAGIDGYIDPVKL